MVLIHPCLHGNFSVSTESGIFLTEARIRLLEAIDRLGSISSAARMFGMSYKWAWDELNGMNSQALSPLVVRNVGGRRGGGTTLTSHGHRVVAFYRALEREYQNAVKELSEHVLATEGEVNFRYLLRRHAIARGLSGTESTETCTTRGRDHV